MKLGWRSAVEWLVSDWGLKLTALVLAFLIWALARADSPADDVLADVPVTVVLRDASWELAGQPAPSTVSIRVSGPVRDLARLRMGDPSVVRLVVDEVTDSVQGFLLQPRHVQWGTGGGESLVVEAITPDQVRLDFDPVIHEFLPVTAGTSNQPPAGFELAGPLQVEPSQVRASGARRRLLERPVLRVPDIDLSNRRSVDTVTLSIDTAGSGLLVTPLQVKVVVPVRAIPADSMVADTMAAPQGPPSAGGGGGPGVR